jgi:hypothetical protein
VLLHFREKCISSTAPRRFSFRCVAQSLLACAEPLDRRRYKAHRCPVAGCNHLIFLPGARRRIRDPGIAGLHLHRGGHRRPPLDADECRRRRATDLASLCSRGLLLGRASAILPLKKPPTDSRFIAHRPVGGRRAGSHLVSQAGTPRSSIRSRGWCARPTLRKRRCWRSRSPSRSAR